MKHFYLILVFSLLSAAVLLTGYGAGPGTAAMNHFIGAPGGTGTTCGTCHGSPGNYGTITTEIRVFIAGTSIPATMYVGGNTYDVEVEVMHPIGAPSRYGFQCVVFDSGNVQAGSFVNPGAGISVVNLASGTQVVEHSSFNTSPVFTFQWVAPNTFTGPIKFWAGGIAANGNGQNTGDGGSTTPSQYDIIPDKNAPIELADFSGRQSDNTVVLEWVTESEIENSHFEIEHSTDVTKFAQIGTVDGAGTTTQTQQYRFVHNNPVLGDNHYYRLKQVDYDGNTSYSDVVTVYMESSIEQVSVFPTPATSEVTVLLNIKNTGIYTQTVYDMSGKIMQQDELNLSAGEQSMKLDIDNWSGGQYIYKLNNNQDQFTTSIVKF